MEGEPSGSKLGRDPNRRQREGNQYYGPATAKGVVNGVLSEPLEQAAKGLINGIPLDVWQSAAAERQSPASPVGQAQWWPTIACQSPGREADFLMLLRPRFSGC